MIRLLFLLLAGLLAAGHARASDVDDAREAFRFAYPVYQMAATRAGAVARVEGAGGRVVNHLNHRPGLSDHSNRNVTTPNNDTLYSASWLDLGAGPVILTVPPSATRYASAALLDLFTDHFALLGTRGRGGHAGRYLIAGPGWRGPVPSGTELIRSPMTDAWLIVRVQVDSADDLAAARKVQTGFRIEPTVEGRRPFAARPGDLSDPQQFLEVVNEALGRGPLPEAHRARARRFARVGIVPGEADAWRKLSPRVQAAWTENIVRFYDELRGGLQAVGTEKNGWSYPEPGIGNFGHDDLYRARIALGGLGALPREEAVYLSARTASDGQPLDGRNAARLRIPAGVPVDAFWSLSLYEIAPDGRLFFVANPLARHAVGDRTPGLQPESDGSLVLSIGAVPPGDPKANWLPAPAGPYALTFRAYLPQQPILDGRFTLPPVERTRP